MPTQAHIWGGGYLDPPNRIWIARVILRAMRQWTGVSRALFGALVSVGVILQPAFAAGDSPSPSHLYGGLIRASFPVGWHVLEHEASLTSQSNSIMYVSNQPIHFTCTTTTQRPGVTDTQCGGPLTRLKPNGVLLRWDANGFPGWNINNDGGQGRSLTIDGLPAKVQITPHGTCWAAVVTMGTNSSMQKQADIGSQETISAVVSARIPNNYLTFNACIRGPDLTRLSKWVMESLRSTKVVQPS